MRRALAALLALAPAVAPAGTQSEAVVHARIRVERFGHSAQRRPLDVTAFGSASVRGRLLLVGCIHGTECAGIAIARAVTNRCPPTSSDVWVVSDLNPDGRRLGIRQNARGVDLNRNYPAGWVRRPPGDPQYAGPRPFSEPESRALRRLALRLRPKVTIWYHQGQGPLVRAWGRSVPAAREYARRAGTPFRRMPWMAGTAPHWQNLAFPRTSSFVVELPDGRLSRAAARQHAAAALALARGAAGRTRQVGGSVLEGR
jgi:protein MpaA